VEIELVDVVYDLFEAFPSLEKQIIDLFISYVLKETMSKEYEVKTKELCFDYIKNIILRIKQEYKNDKSLMNAYYDVARYQTDTKDAAILWSANEDLLCLMLKKRPPPETPLERHKLPVPNEVIKKREI
jgi:hypothetical protein